MAEELANNFTGTWAPVQIDGIVREVKGVNMIESVGQF